MYHATIDHAAPTARHERLFELIRQQNRALAVAGRMASAPHPSMEALMEVAQRAAASWRKMC